jgi:hypothetical protein
MYSSSLPCVLHALAHITVDLIIIITLGGEYKVHEVRYYAITSNLLFRQLVLHIYKDAIKT